MIKAYPAGSINVAPFSSTTGSEERLTYVERRPNPRDRRSSVVRMTPWGVEESSRHLLPLAADFFGIAEALPEGDRTVVGGYLEEVAATLARHARGG